MTLTPPPNDMVALIRQMQLQMQELTRRRLVRAQTFEVMPSAHFIIPFSATMVDIPGSSVTFTTTRDNATAVVTCCFDWQLSATGTGLCYGGFALDGTTQDQANFTAQSVETRIPGSFTKRITVPTAGTHTVKLQGRKELNAGTATFTGSSQTSVLVTLYD